MTPQEKDLLLRDLCARLPYGVKFKADDEEYIREIHYIKDEDVYIREYRNLSYWIYNIKPYLRPLSDMTEEERNKYKSLCEHCMDEMGYDFCYDTIESFDYLISIHIDYRGLIPMGLALPATKDMYNIKK